MANLALPANWRNQAITPTTALSAPGQVVGEMAILRQLNNG
jgi:hypothetical protein